MSKIEYTDEIRKFIKDNSTVVRTKDGDLFYKLDKLYQVNGVANDYDELSEPPMSYIDAAYELNNPLTRHNKDLEELASKKVKSFGQMVTWLKKHKKSNTRNALIKHITDRVMDINGSGGYITTNMHKQEYLAFVQFRQNNK